MCSNVCFIITIIRGKLKNCEKIYDLLPFLKRAFRKYVLLNWENIAHCLKIYHYCGISQMFGIFIKHNGKQGCIFIYINEVSRILQILFIMADMLFVKTNAMT